MKFHRTILGAASVLLIAAWVAFVEWGHGMSAFGSGAGQGNRAGVLEYVPLLIFVLVLCSSISPSRYLLHIVAVCVAPCVAITIYLLFTNLNVGFWLAFYFGLWCEMYYKLAWKNRDE